MECQKYKELVVRCEALEKQITSLEPESPPVIEKFLRKMVERTRNQMEKFEMERLPRQFLKRQEWRKIREELHRIYTDNTSSDPFFKLSDDILKVLGELVLEEDLKNCYNASLALRKAVLPRSPLWRLGEVLPYVVPYFGLEDIWKCRQVCKTWKVSVDDFLKISATPQPFISKHYLRLLQEDSVNRRLSSLSIFESVACVDEAMFLIETEDPLILRNLFRCVSFEPSEEDGVQFWQRIPEFLIRFGEHIWECRFVVEETQNPGFFLTLLRNFLMDLPNLRKLYIELIPKEDDEVTTEMYMEPLRRSPRAFSFPELPYLLSLDMMGLPSYFANFALPLYAANLHTLTVSYLDIQYSTPELLNEFRNLTTLSVSAEEDEDLTRLLLLTSSRIKKLTLVQYATVNFKLECVLLVLQHFSSTLEYVSLQYNHLSSLPPIPYITSGLEIFQELWLPHVKILEFKEYYGSFNFLLCCPSLQFVSVQWNKIFVNDVVLYGRDTDGEVVEVYDSFAVHRMNFSNIWKLIPSLKEFKYTGKSEETVEARVNWRYSRARREYVFSRMIKWDTHNNIELSSWERVAKFFCVCPCP